MLVLKRTEIKRDAIRRKLNSTNFLSLQRIARIKAEKILGVAKVQMLKRFDSHSITQEILAGPQATNISRTLGGYGNLFSFIGFNEGEDPTAKLRTLLRDGVVMSAPKYANRMWKFYISVPTKASIASVTKMPWSSESWALSVEKYIAGLGQYLRTDNSESSRSGGGVQTQRIKSSSFSPRAYLSEILTKLKAEIENRGV